ncbi:MAG: hypothetical protein M2R45_02282 [Verrucomicrobia subdivision 3 bacterium]|nr:hypothetical protein [Limisphaerales bacterium]MCS1414661.1 hypothetical protein [Limisphaerales bacterium]
MPPIVDEVRTPVLFASMLLAVGVGWIGCATVNFRPPFPLTGDPIRDGWTGITNGPVEDRVLWQYRTALELCRRADFPTASTLFDEALRVVEGRYGADASARRSRSYFVGEAHKRFIGEPYERAMAYYYRGMLYWKEGELDNARACFRSAQVEDSDVEDGAYAGDYVLMDYLDGLASFRLNGQGIDAYRRATNSATLVIPDRYESVGNVLFFVEYGKGPEKYATGSYREQLRFRDCGSEAVEVILRSRGQVAHIGAMDDLAYQATTRGGRLMDHILANKAVFKAAADTVGDASLVTGLILAQDRKTQEAGVGIAAFGMVSKLFSAATTPSADTRSWDNLPKYLAFGSLSLPPGRHSVEVAYLNDHREAIASLAQQVTVDVAEGNQDTVMFISQFNQKEGDL